mgnify:CR=1 FL=1
MTVLTTMCIRHTRAGTAEQNSFDIQQKITLVDFTYHESKKISQLRKSARISTITDSCIVNVFLGQDAFGSGRIHLSHASNDSFLERIISFADIGKHREG